MKKSIYIITGSSKGLGKSMVEHLVQYDLNQVIGISRSGLDLHVDNYTDLHLDLSDTDTLINQLESIFPDQDFDRLVLINNAGSIGEIGPLGKLAPAGIAELHAINVIAPAILMNAFIKKYKGYQAEKIVVNISSGAAGKNMDGWAGYSSSKAALNRMTEIAQKESMIHHHGIKYYALSPGIIDTPMQETIRSASEQDFSMVETFKDYKHHLQLSSPEEVVKKVMYLIEHTDKFSEVLQDVRKF